MSDLLREIKVNQVMWQGKSCFPFLLTYLQFNKSALSSYCSTFVIQNKFPLANFSESTNTDQNKPKNREQFHSTGG